MRYRVMTASWLAAAVSACGGGSSPTTPASAPQPTPTPRTVLTVLSGEDETPLTGAKVMLGGTPLAPDGAGRVTLPTSTRAGDPIDILAAGFFDRQTSVPALSGNVGLWPLTSSTGLDEGSTSRLVYTSTADGAAPGQAPLLRPAAPVFLVPSAELRDDPGSMLEMGYAAATVTEATGGRLPFSVTTDPPSGAIRFDVSLDPADAYCIESGALAFCRRFTRAWSITGGAIVFCRKSSLYSLTMTHEVGHAIGLNHSADLRDMMGVPYTTRRSSSFTPREQLAIRLMLQRPPGNRFPDSDRPAASASATSESVIVCR